MILTLIQDKRSIISVYTIINVFLYDSGLDWEDLTHSENEERRKRVGRPSTGNAKQLIALRVSPKVLAKIRKLAEKAGKPYQSYIHEILEKLTKKAA